MAARIDFQTEPGRYRHWKLNFDGEVAEIAPAGVDFRVPVVSEFHRCVRAFGCCHENQRITAFLVLKTALFDEPQFFDKKIERLVQIGHADHGVEIFHG